MGDDDWTLREPGSVTGSYVPPPATPEEPQQSRPPPLPRRKPQANWPRRVSGNQPPEPESARQAAAGEGPARHVSGVGQRRLQLAQPEVTAPPELQDNVRYLFKPILTPPVANPVEIDQDLPRIPGGEPPGEKPAEDRRAGSLRHEQAGWTTTSAGSSGPPAAGQAALADLPRRPPTGGRTRGRITWVAAILLVAVATVGTGFALIRHVPSGSRAGSRQRQISNRDRRTGAKAISVLSTAAIVRGQAARWILAEISRSAIVGCDDVMCNDLINQGMAASNLLVLGANAPDPLGADILVSTSALRSQFGSRLASEYAPVVIASFGTGKSRVDVRAVALYGGAAYNVAENRDLAARQRNSSTLVHNSKIAVAASAQPDLIAGLVDSRLLVMLPVLASQHPIRILGFYDRAPRSAQGVPLTGAELASSDSASGLSGASYRRWLLTFLRGQQPPFRPVSVTTGLIHGHEAVVRVRFSRPSPIGLLNSTVRGSYAYQR